MLEDDGSIHRACFQMYSGMGCRYQYQCMVGYHPKAFLNGSLLHWELYAHPEPVERKFRIDK